MSEIPIPRDALEALLAVERTAYGAEASLEDFFGSPDTGDLLARIALAAWDESVPGPLLWLHASFLGAAPAATALALRVEALPGPKETARRHVRVEGKEPVADATLCFAEETDGPTYQDPALPRQLPDPDTMPSTVEQARAEGWPEAYAQGPLEFRRATSLQPDRARGESTVHETWLRPRVPLAEDPLLHRAAAVFCCGFYAHWEYERRIADFAHAQFAPLEVGLWLHGTAMFDDWWLLRATSEVGHAGLALSRRELFTRTGHLVASTTGAARVAKG